MQQDFGNLSHTSDGHSISLFNSQRMIGRLKFDKRSLAKPASMHVGLQVQRLRV
jgi:hypothetical protein